MRAWEIRGSFGLDRLVLAEREVVPPGPGQVRVRVRAASLNYRDLLMVTGRYNPRQPLPLVPGSDGVGVVEAVGPGVEAAMVGRRVAGLFAQRWLAGPPDAAILRSTLGGPRDGMLAESVVLEAEGIVDVPDHLSDEEAATLPCAALTAWSALVELGNVKAGDTVLVQGTGGVSSFAIAFARMHGARVIATSRKIERHDELRAQGVEAVIDPVADPQWGKAVRNWTAGVGVDHVVEVGGTGTMAQSLRAVRPGGTIALIGILAGGAAELDLTPALMHQVRIQGVFVGSRAGFLAMNRAVAAHGLRPTIDRVFGLDDVPAAFAHLASGQHVGKICVRVG
jgi:NADPH:quinone reductase-like Zn-dependent oxidoreductase